MKLSALFRQTGYYLLLLLSCLISLCFIYMNTEEVINRSTGQNTLFSQMSWLTDGEAALYCSLLVFLFVFLLTLTGYRLYQKNRKAVISICTLTLLLAICTLAFERLLYYQPS